MKTQRSRSFKGAAFILPGCPGSYRDLKYVNNLLITAVRFNALLTGICQCFNSGIY
jgi:hypothetical protein